MTFHFFRSYLILHVICATLATEMLMTTYDSPALMPKLPQNNNDVRGILMNDVRRIRMTSYKYL